jgi:hypothetical protein
MKKPGFYLSPNGERIIELQFKISPHYISVTIDFGNDHMNMFNIGPDGTLILLDQVDCLLSAWVLLD